MELILILTFSEYYTRSCDAVYSYTPLHLAVERHHEEIMNLLLSRGANTDTKGADGATALHIAVERGYIQIVEHLLNHGANINCAYTSREGYTPLHLAVKENEREIMKLPLSRGANIDDKKEDGTTALHIATENRNIDFVEYLLNSGANINCAYTSTIRKGYTPLHLVVSKYGEEIIKLLFRRGANVDAKGNDGTTALHIAAHIGNIYIFEHLLNHGADINSASLVSYLRKNGRTTFQIVSDKYNRIYTTIANMLERHMIKMKTASLYLSEENLLFITNDHNISYFQNECEKEIEKMKSEKVNNTNVSFYDILTKDINHLAMYAGNEIIVQVLRSYKFKIKFPLYADMINNHFRKGEKRKKLLEQSHKIFHFFFTNFGLPEECAKNIFSYLSNEDLRILMDPS